MNGIKPMNYFIRVATIVSMLAGFLLTSCKPRDPVVDITNTPTPIVIVYPTLTPTPEKPTPEPTIDDFITPTSTSTLPPPITACGINNDVYGVKSVYGPLFFNENLNDNIDDNFIYEATLRERIEPLEVSFYSNSLFNLYQQDASVLENIFLASDVDANGEIITYKVVYDTESGMFKSKISAEIGTSRTYSLSEYCNEILESISDEQIILRNLYNPTLTPVVVPTDEPTDEFPSCPAPRQMPDGGCCPDGWLWDPISEICYKSGPD